MHKLIGNEIKRKVFRLFDNRALNGKYFIILYKEFEKYDKRNTDW